MSSERHGTLLSLVGELNEIEARLDAQAAPADALAFLDLLVRCESFPVGAIDRAGVSAHLESASRRRGGQGELLGALAARAIDPDALLEKAHALIEEAEAGGSPEPLGWAAELLRAANATPYLPPPRRDRVAAILEEIVDLIEAIPAPFVDTAELARQRSEQEHPERIPDTLGADLLAAFAEAPALAAYDQEQEEGAEDEGGRYGPPLPSDLPSRLRESRPTVLFQAPAPLRLAAVARDFGIGDHSLLRRLEQGELVLTRVEGQRYVDWYGSGTPRLMIEAEGQVRALPSEPIEDGLRWELSGDDGELRLLVELDGIRFELVIPA